MMRVSFFVKNKVINQFEKSQIRKTHKRLLDQFMFSLEVVRGSINQLLRINELSPSSDLIILVHSLELKIKDYYL